MQLNLIKKHSDKKPLEVRRNITFLAFAFLSILWLAACQPAPDSSNSTETTHETATSESGMDAESIAAQDTQSCELTMGWDPWEPYHFAAAGGQAQGLDIDLIEALGTRVGCEFEFIQGNWASLLLLLKAGELDVLAGASITPEREEYARFSDTYREERFALFVRSEERSQWQGKTLASLLDDGFRVGITQGYSYPDPIQALQYDADVSAQFREAAIGELNINALLEYQIDGFLEDPYVVASIQRRSRAAGEIEPLDLDFGMNDVHFLFSRESVSEARVDAFDQALEAMMSDGSHAALLARYLN